MGGARRNGMHNSEEQNKKIAYGIAKSGKTRRKHTEEEKKKIGAKGQKNAVPKSPKSSIIELANNTDFSVETIAKEAKRINEREGEVFISLH